MFLILDKVLTNIFCLELTVPARPATFDFGQNFINNFEAPADVMVDRAAARFYSITSR